MLICYHGTTKRNAESILRGGFKPDSWFALHLEDAIEFGGAWVFETSFKDEVAHIGWQFHCRKAVPPTRIVGLKEYRVRVVEENRKLRDKIFPSHP